MYWYNTYLHNNLNKEYYVLIFLYTHVYNYNYIIIYEKEIVFYFMKI